MKSVTLIIGACIIILFMSSVLTAINAFRMTDYDEEHIITTGATTTADVTLSQDLFSGETYNSEVSSNITADAPIPFAYNESTQVLTISGLAESETRRLTIEYKIDALEDYPATGIGSRMWPVLIVIALIGIIAAAVYNAVQKD